MSFHADNINLYISCLWLQTVNSAVITSPHLIMCENYLIDTLFEKSVDNP